MAGASDEEWDKLQDFDTYRLIGAVDEVDALRSMVADDGTRPLEIRNRLFKLHQLAMAVINEDVQEFSQRAQGVVQSLHRFQHVEHLVVQLLRQLEQFARVLLPKSLDDDGGDDADEK